MSLQSPPVNPRNPSVSSAAPGDYANDTSCDDNSAASQSRANLTQQERAAEEKKAQSKQPSSKKTPSSTLKPDLPMAVTKGESTPDTLALIESLSSLDDAFALTKLSTALLDVSSSESGVDDNHASLSVDLSALLNDLSKRFTNKKVHITDPSGLADVEIQVAPCEENLGLMHTWASHPALRNPTLGLGAASALMRVANHHKLKKVCVLGDKDVAAMRAQVEQYVVPFLSAKEKDCDLRSLLLQKPDDQQNNGQSGGMNFSQDSNGGGDGSRDHRHDGDLGDPHSADSRGSWFDNPDMNVIGFVEWVMNNTYAENQNSLLLFGARTEGYNKLQAAYREELEKLYKEQGKYAGYNNSQDLPGGGMNYNEYPSSFIPNSTGDNPKPSSTSHIKTKGDLDAAVQVLNDDLNEVGGNATVANLDLQQVMQKQTQFTQMMTNVAKMSFDANMSVARNITAN